MSHKKMIGREPCYADKLQSSNQGHNGSWLQVAAYYCTVQYKPVTESARASSSLLLSATNALDSIILLLPPPPLPRTFLPTATSAGCRLQHPHRPPPAPLAGPAPPAWRRRAPRKDQNALTRGRPPAALGGSGGARIACLRTVRVWPSATLRVREAAACAYDRAAYKLRGEYARLNFPHLKNSSAECSESMRALRSAVDSKIQAICQRIGRQKKKGKKDKDKEIGEDNNESKREDSVGPVSESSCSSVSEESLMDGEFSLDRMPSFDPEIIWEVLAN
ncbi:uncharacterized protein A4U43_C05F26930 [Asparagus officinalis]|uniref:AP2/ERF domain-containing protein n=1 Tax=Asparagus officinalis TaxID=4686 RepID=A0A5P1EUS5_ASPOF|nr:uncharacterized protein A4U43_C05F26930 [Asparagus officinalis]